MAKGKTPTPLQRLEKTTKDLVQTTGRAAAAETAVKYEQQRVEELREQLRGDILTIIKDISDLKATMGQPNVDPDSLKAWMDTVDQAIGRVVEEIGKLNGFGDAVQDVSRVVEELLKLMGDAQAANDHLHNELLTLAKAQSHAIAGVRSSQERIEDAVNEVKTEVGRISQTTQEIKQGMQATPTAPTQVFPLPAQPTADAVVHLQPELREEPLFPPHPSAEPKVATVLSFWQRPIIRKVATKRALASSLLGAAAVLVVVAFLPWHLLFSGVAVSPPIPVVQTGDDHPQLRAIVKNTERTAVAVESMQKSTNTVDQSPPAPKPEATLTPVPKWKELGEQRVGELKSLNCNAQLTMDDPPQYYGTMVVEHYRKIVNDCRQDFAGSNAPGDITSGDIQTLRDIASRFRHGAVR